MAVDLHSPATGNWRAASPNACCPSFSPSIAQRVVPPGATPWTVALTLCFQ